MGMTAVAAIAVLVVRGRCVSCELCETTAGNGPAESGGWFPVALGIVGVIVLPGGSSLRALGSAVVSCRALTWFFATRLFRRCAERVCGSHSASLRYCHRGRIVLSSFYCKTPRSIAWIALHARAAKPPAATRVRHLPQLGAPLEARLVMDDEKHPLVAAIYYKTGSSCQLERRALLDRLIAVVLQLNYDYPPRIPSQCASRHKIALWDCRVLIAANRALTLFRRPPFLFTNISCFAGGDVYCTRSVPVGDPVLPGNLPYSLECLRVVLGV